MKFSKDRSNKLLIQGLAIVLILLGITITAKHMTMFARGYFIQSDHLITSSKYLPVASEVTNEPETSGLISGIPESDEERALYPEPPKEGDKIGELYIPKLDSTLPIYEGTSEDELEVGVGHYADSVLPGEKDNSVLAGHRDTVFRNLGDVGTGDSLIVRTAAGEFEYKVKKVRIVDKDDLTVIVPKPRATLTLSTCYPFSYIGAAPERYVLVAYLTSKTLYEQ